MIPLVWHSRAVSVHSQPVLKITFIYAKSNDVPATLLYPRFHSSSSRFVVACTPPSISAQTGVQKGVLSYVFSVRLGLQISQQLEIHFARI